jgi:enoyl-CoA hydratase/carnithine racemase
VPLAELLPTAERWARTICECSPLSVQATKQCVYEGLGRTIDEAMGTRYPLVSRLYKSDDFKEGPRAFAEKRTPVWKGR